MKHSVCEEGKCFACGACAYVCPKNCISKQMLDDGSHKYMIDDDNCIHCKKCERVCPNISSTEFHTAVSSYAAWRTDENEHMKSASGGVASAFYEYAADNGMYFAGVTMERNFEAHYHLSNKKTDIEAMRNSKYTFSFIDGLYGQIEDKLLKGHSVVFIGLPCQCAAIINFMKLKRMSGQLITVDLVCHGTPPPQYLQQHIRSIEEKKCLRFEKLFFRDTKFDSSNYVYTLYTHNSTEPEYKKSVHEDDNYQIGYHNALIYRNVCYDCKYARRGRVADITIGDYHGIGMLSPYAYERKNLSCVIVHTETGAKFLKAIQNSSMLVLHERPLEEPMYRERQFNSPSVAPFQREIFLKEYKQCQNFEKAAERAFRKYRYRNMVKSILHVKEIKSGIMKCIPRRTKESVKAFMRKVRS